MTGGSNYRVGLIGAGKVGIAFVKALVDAGHRVSAVWDPSADALDRSRDVLGEVTVPDGPAPVGDRSDLVVIAVPDALIAGVAGELAALPDGWLGTFVMHVSGRCGTDVLDPLRGRGARTAAIHPAMTFTGDVATEVSRMKGARFAVTGGPDALPVAFNLVDQIGGVPVEVAESGRVTYHAALTHGSNNLVALVVQAAQIIQTVGVAEPAELLGPPLRAALENALQLGAAGATGPVVRGDDTTIRDHLAAISAAAPAVVPAYRHLSLTAAEIAHNAGRLNDAAYDRLQRALDHTDDRS